MSLRPALLVLLALTAAPASAQTVYKSVMPNGSVVYGNDPAKGAAKVDRIAVEPPVVSDSPPAPPSPEAAQRVRENLRADDAAWAQADQEVRSAEQVLSAAKLAQQAGEAPLPGEMVGTASGGMRPSQAYFERQQQLAEDVRQAKARVDAALAARNALR